MYDSFRAVEWNGMAWHDMTGFNNFKGSSRSERKERRKDRYLSLGRYMHSTYIER